MVMDAGVTKRRPHKKSKAGCTQCKRRHIKCDEGRPACSSCVVADLTCPYLSEPKPSSTPPDRRVQGPSPPTLRQEQSLEASTGPSTPNLLAGFAINAPNIDVPDVNALHLQLFYHFTTETCRSFARSDELVDIFRRNIVRCAFTHQYLLNELLALAALHISTHAPDQAEHYVQLATVLQLKALAEFDDALKNIDESNCMSLLFFSHLLGVHSFQNVFSSQDSPLGDLLGRLTHTTHLLRGVQTLISPWWDVFMASEMGTFLRGAEEFRISHQDLDTVIPHLHRLVADADVSDATRRVYEHALQTLDLSLHVEEDVNGPRDDINRAFSWLMTMSQDFVKLLSQRRPEALVFLAYFAVTLHHRRKSWVVGSAGERLLHAIRSYLGVMWDEWLEWPTQKILE